MQHKFQVIQVIKVNVSQNNVSWNVRGGATRRGSRLKVPKHHA